MTSSLTWESYGERFLWNAAHGVIQKMRNPQTDTVSNRKSFIKAPVSQEPKEDVSKEEEAECCRSSTGKGLRSGTTGDLLATAGDCEMNEPSQSPPHEGELSDEDSLFFSDEEDQPGPSGVARQAQSQDLTVPPPPPRILQQLQQCWPQ